jgi:galactofuranosylgalactofuranosylrhamnosyl-N-acetylglucosaminyl-diphospho-decaprenol beta-1,5/1,6-galactofuranosyltransferase
VKVLVKSSVRWSSLVQEWEAAYGEFTSTKFWQQYLKLKERTNSQVKA